MTETVAESPRTTSGVPVRRYFSDPDRHPYDEVEWESRDVVITDRGGAVVFEQRGVEFPASWSQNATQIVASKYFRGAAGTPDRETSLRQLIDRVVGRYTAAGVEHGQLTPGAAPVFAEELTWLLLNQHFSFNSPVWFNVGTAGRQQVSACFILAVEDSMESILNWYREEGLIFKGGSGAGINLSRLRSSRELLSSGGTASGPVSFMRGADASAGTIKSGGATRRAAKMVVLDVDHPDIGEFVRTKRNEEEKIRVLRDAGFDMDLGGADMASVQYQNANNSVRVSDRFMEAAERGERFPLTSRTSGEAVEEVDAGALLTEIAEAAWACADPGLQYDDTIQGWHTCPEDGRISASNPCSEYMHLDNSSCNLASINLIAFLDPDGVTFQTARFAAAVELIITAMDISVDFADFPTAAIGEVTRRYRQLGIGYANLGALLMATGHAYDSEGGRRVAREITSLMSAVAYRRSGELARAAGPYSGFGRNADAHRRVVSRHRAAHDAAPYRPQAGPRGAADRSLEELRTAAGREWRSAEELAAGPGLRNAQVSLLAPTGTIGFMMDCDTTGIEPDFALVKSKKLVGGGTMAIVNRMVPRALTALGYQPEQVEAIAAHIGDHGHVLDAPGLRREHYEVFDCAVGERAIAPMGHVRMMAAVQPFLSGAISKTVNMPQSATVEDVRGIYVEAWRSGLKALAVYRDNCKVGQPLSVKEAAAGPAAEAHPRPVRRRLPKRRPSETTSFSVGGAEGYMTVGSYPDNGPGELFVKMSKQGSTLAGIMDAFSMAISIALQYGVPLDTFVEKFTNMRFEPAGMTDDPELRLASSVVDYIFRRMALDHLPVERRRELGIRSTEERGDAEPTGAPISEAAAPAAPELPRGPETDAPLCLTCGTEMRRAGSCFACEGCGSTSGCS